MIVLGVDPGTRATGYGIVAVGDDHDLTLLECGAIRPNPGDPLAQRLLDIFEGMAKVIERNRPDVMSVEGVFYGQNVRTTVVLGHARGAVLLAAATRSIQVAEYPPAEIKNCVVGTGAARKEQVAFMVQRHLGLQQPPSPPDAADGVAAALCHLFNNGVTVAGGSRRGGVGRKLSR